MEDPFDTTSHTPFENPFVSEPADAPASPGGRPEDASGKGAGKRAAAPGDTGGASTPGNTPPPNGPRQPSRLEQYAGQVLSGNILTRAEVRRYYPYVFFMAGLMLLYIANGYNIQKLHRRHDRLAEQIKELRARSLTLSSMRMSATRQSEIIRQLDQRGIPLHESLSPPKVIEE